MAEIQAIPDKVVKAAARKADEVKTEIKVALAKKVADIQATPQKLAKAAKRKADSVVTEISMLPNKTATAFVKKVQKTKLVLLRGYKEKLVALGLSTTAADPATIKPPPEVRPTSPPMPVITPVAAAPALSGPTLAASEKKRDDAAADLLSAEEADLKKNADTKEEPNKLFGSFFPTASKSVIATVNKPG